MILTNKQTTTLDVLEDNSNGVTEIIYGGSAGSGKSIIGCYWILKLAIKYAGIRLGLGRAELKTLKRTTLVSFFEVCKMQGLVAGEHYVYKEQASEIHFFNGSVVILMDLAYMPSDDKYDRIGGIEVSAAFVDEIAQIRKQAWDILKTRIRYKLKEFGLIPKLFGSLNPMQNWVYTYFYKPFKAKTIEPHKYFQQALPIDNPHLTQDYLNTLSQLPKRERDRLYLGKWEAGDDNQLINNDNMHSMFTNEFIKPLPSDKKYLTIDVARKGKDKSIIMLWNGFIIEKIWTYKKNSIQELVDKVKEITKQYQIPKHNVVADESGVGGGLVDFLGCKGFVGGSKALNNENYFNLRTQAFYHLANYINQNLMYFKASITDEVYQEIIEELEQVQSDTTTDEGKLKIISKDQIKSNIGRSPDYSDSLSMRMYFTLNKGTGRARVA